VRLSVLVLIAAAVTHTAAAQVAARPPASALAADSSFSARSVAAGFRVAIEEAAANDAVLVYAGVPVVWSRPFIARILAAQPMLDSIVVRLIPVHFEIARDSTLAVVYGITSTTRRGPAAGEPQLGWYANVWRRQPDGIWRLAAAAQVGVVASRLAVVPPELSAPPHAPFIPGPFDHAFSDADIAFADLAHRENARVAFERFASPQGASISGDGLLLLGPSQIGESLGGSETQDWKWAPVAAGGTPSGDLGFTIGEASIGPRAGGSGATRYSKYLTLWRRSADGAVKFIFDVGNLRPAPK
jgi:ketosteroid isomerase-like protein